MGIYDFSFDLFFLFILPSFKCFIFLLLNPILLVRVEIIIGLWVIQKSRTKIIPNLKDKNFCWIKKYKERILYFYILDENKGEVGIF